MDFATDAYATAIATKLSREEIKEAIAFFKTSEGREYLRYTRSMSLQRRGIPDPDPKRELTTAENQAMTKFMGKSAGKKLLQDHVLDGPDLSRSLQVGMRDLYEHCNSRH
jgi:hypothetical protein